MAKNHLPLIWRYNKNTRVFVRVIVIACITAIHMKMPRMGWNISTSFSSLDLMQHLVAFDM